MLRGVNPVYDFGRSVAAVVKLCQTIGVIFG
jgi:hypothetical protein